MRRLTATAFLGITGLGYLLCAAPGAQAQDAKALLDKTFKAYHDLSTYSGKISADIDVIASNGRKAPLSAQNADFQYKRPNRLFLKFSSRAKNLSVYSDAGKLTVYQEEVLQYTRVPTAPNLSAMLPLLHTQAGIDAMLDPLYFLSSTALPPELTNLKTQGVTTVNDRPVIIVSGVWQPTAGSTAKPSSPFLTKGARWTLYIDKASYLLQKVEAQVPMTINQQVKQKDNKIVTAKLAATMSMRETIVDVKANPPLDDSLFLFTPPKGATEQKDANELLKGGTGTGHAF